MSNTIRTDDAFPVPNEEGVDTQDDDPSNMILRAGYLVGLSMKCPPGSEDRKFLQRAARSLALAARKTT